MESPNEEYHQDSRNESYYYPNITDSTTGTPSLYTGFRRNPDNNGELELVCETPVLNISQRYNIEVDNPKLPALCWETIQLQASNYRDLNVAIKNKVKVFSIAEILAKASYEHTKMGKTLHYIFFYKRETYRTDCASTLRKDFLRHLNQNFPLKDPKERLRIFHNVGTHIATGYAYGHTCFGVISLEYNASKRKKQGHGKIKASIKDINVTLEGKGRKVESRKFSRSVVSVYSKGIKLQLTSSLGTNFNEIMDNIIGQIEQNLHPKPKVLGVRCTPLAHLSNQLSPLQITWSISDNYGAAFRYMKTTHGVCDTYPDGFTRKVIAPITKKSLFLKKEYPFSAGFTFMRDGTIQPYFAPNKDCLSVYKAENCKQIIDLSSKRLTSYASITKSGRRAESIKFTLTITEKAYGDFFKHFGFSTSEILNSNKSVKIRPPSIFPRRTLKFTHFSDYKIVKDHIERLLDDNKGLLPSSYTKITFDDQKKEITLHRDVSRHLKNKSKKIDELLLTTTRKSRRFFDRRVYGHTCDETPSQSANSNSNI